MQVYFFRPKRRENLIARIRQYGWHTRIIYDVHKVTKDVPWMILDAAVGNWKTMAAVFVKRGVRVLLLADDELSEAEVTETGISGLLRSNEQFCTRLLEWVHRNGKQHQEATTFEERTEPVPLSQRKKRDDASAQTIKEVVTLPAAEDNIAEMNLQHQEATADPEAFAQPTVPIPATPSVVTVYGAKGGVGKTVFLLSLAAELTQLGAKVCVLDLDMYQGTVASTQLCHPEWTLTDLVRHVCDPGFRQTCLLQSEMGFYFIAAPTTYMDISGITASSISDVIRYVKEEMDFVLMDTSSLFDDVVKNAMEQSDQVLLMTSDEPASVKNLHRMAGELDKVKGPKLAVVWNRVPEKARNLEEWETWLPWTSLLVLPEDADVKRSVSEGRFTTLHAENPYAMQVRQLAGVWSGVEADIVRPPRRAGWRQRLWRQKGREDWHEHS